MIRRISNKFKMDLEEIAAEADLSNTKANKTQLFIRKQFLKPRHSVRNPSPMRLEPISTLLNIKIRTKSYECKIKTAKDFACRSPIKKTTVISPKKANLLKEKLEIFCDKIDYNYNIKLQPKIFLLEETVDCNVNKNAKKKTSLLKFMQIKAEEKLELSTVIA